MVNSKVLKRIMGRGRGSVFSAKDFIDIGSRAAVDQTLARLTKSGKIRRLKRGLYDYPKTNGKLGQLSPSPDRIAHAVAAKTGSRLLASGAQAANVLGLSTQVPAKLVYLTDGPDRVVQVGNQTISLKKASSKYFTLDGSAALAVQAMRFLGKNALDGSTLQQLRDVLSLKDKTQLLQGLRHLPGWMVPMAKQVAAAA